MEHEFSISLVVFFVFLVLAIDAQNTNRRVVTCSDNEYDACYGKDLYCPDECPRTCVPDCNRCQAVCHLPPPGQFYSPPPPTTYPPPLATTSPPPPIIANRRVVTCSDNEYDACYRKDLYCPDECPQTCVPDCNRCQAVCHLPPPGQFYSPPPPTTYPPPLATTSPPPPVTVYPPPTPDISPAPSSELPDWWGTAACMNLRYPSCYRIRHYCPGGCPDECMVDCVTCSPVCQCDRPGAVCQDPKFVGADGLTFYFHGKKNQDFCILSDPNLHINAHFIGRRIQGMSRDFTWVQSIGILFDDHQLVIGAEKTAVWVESVDRLYISFDQDKVIFPVQKGATWRANTSRSVTITRTHEANGLLIEVEGIFTINVRVVPITQKESVVHNYGITTEDCFAHLDLGFKFYSLSGEVDGVLGQTYARKYVSRVKMGLDMPVLGGDKEFISSSLLSTDCAVSRFNGLSKTITSFNYADMNCASGVDGRGVICKR